ncbi:hypothetical protein [Geminisphaera colitermitum]|uniref:hypothetical protein n=1 Tax=Geminisphaera colitermitum TaxID=1148786 RepID=UPI00030070DA|nr:hypothetical protein [Geminisphaera colitermitum]
MHHTLIVALLARRNFLRARWEGKLRALPPSSALAEPDALVHLMGWTLEQFYQELQPTGRPPPPPDPESPHCPCGINPLIAYFVTGEAAVLEEMLDPQGRWIALEPDQRMEEMARARAAIRRVAAREIESFCAVCQHRKRHASDRRAHHAPQAAHAGL